MADNLGFNPFESSGGDILGRAKQLVWEHAYHVLNEKKTHSTFGMDEVFPVWYSKSLKNWKALFTTSLPDGRYYELTCNGERSEVYIDVYRKTHHLTIPWVADLHG